MTQQNPATKIKVMEPIDSARPEIKKLIRRVLDAEKEKLHMMKPRGINDDILRIIKEEIQ
jgi:hypothetical protein